MQYMKNMKRHSLLLVLVLFSVSLKSQNSSSLLWEISGNGLKQPSYLFGTIHIIPKSDYFFTDEMKQAFDSCKALVLEADMFSISLSEKIKMVNKVLIPDGKTLEQYMDSNEYAYFKQVLKDSLGISGKKVDKKYARIKPFFLTALLLQEFVGKTKTYEQELFNDSKKNDMSLLGLETIEFQLSLAEEIPFGEQLTELTDMNQYRSYSTMVALYKRQDLDGLHKMSIEEYKTPAEKEFLDLFLTKRNSDWIPKIEKMINEQPCFIAVGALHLPGETGVIELLKKEGFTVNPVKEK